MNNSEPNSMHGGCDCGHVRYEITQQPLYVHCCHCTWCQRESGAAFALNALIETAHVKQTGQAAQLIDTPTASGRGQQIARCPKCFVAVWSHYGGLGSLVSFIKVGTMDDTSLVKPDIHIFTSSKQEWFELPKNTPAFEHYYDKKQMWPQASLQRFARLIEQHK